MHVKEQQQQLCPCSWVQYFMAVIESLKALSVCNVHRILDTKEHGLLESRGLL